ncbi:hypothetical protein [Flavobacterium sp.]|uniref:hypothetical protein n=1 Tax=Flavobacterium sp. TaxID=239 RepID=UPI0039E6CE29
MVATKDTYLFTNYLVLRKNQTFALKVRFIPWVNSGYAAGKYTIDGDTLHLFFRNHTKVLVFTNNRKNLNWGDEVYAVVQKDR